VSRARLTVVEPDLFELDVFEMAAPIQSPAKREVRSVLRFNKAKDELPAEIHKQIVAVYGDVMNLHLFLHRKKHLAGKKFDDDDEVQEVMTWFKGQATDFYDSAIQLYHIYLYYNFSPPKYLSTCMRHNEVECNESETRPPPPVRDLVRQYCCAISKGFFELTSVNHKIVWGGEKERKKKRKCV
jgi:hypothetical protein